MVVWEYTLRGETADLDSAARPILDFLESKLSFRESKTAKSELAQKGEIGPRVETYEGTLHLACGGAHDGQETGQVWYIACGAHRGRNTCTRYFIRKRVRSLLSGACLGFLCSQGYCSFWGQAQGTPHLALSIILLYHTSKWKKA